VKNNLNLERAKTDLDFKDIVFRVGCAGAMTVGSIFIHELSHLLAMRVLFTGIDPYIGCDYLNSVHPHLNGGYSCYAALNGHPVVRPEYSIKLDTGLGIVAAAGPFADLALVAVSSMIAWKGRHSHRSMSPVLGLFASLKALHLTSYAWNTLGTNFGDFANIEKRLGVSHHIQTAILGSVSLSTILLNKKIIDAEIKILCGEGSEVARKPVYVGRNPAYSVLN
jgi:hypothetical protein